MKSLYIFFSILLYLFIFLKLKSILRELVCEKSLENVFNLISIKKCLTRYLKVKTVFYNSMTSKMIESFANLQIHISIVGKDKPALFIFQRILDFPLFALEKYLFHRIGRKGKRQVELKVEFLQEPCEGENVNKLIVGAFCKLLSKYLDSLMNNDPYPSINVDEEKIQIA